MNKPNRPFRQIWNMNLRLSRHPVWLGVAARQHERHLCVSGRLSRSDTDPLAGRPPHRRADLAPDRRGQRSHLDPFWTAAPLFLAGALVSSLMLVLMPKAPSLWVAAVLLWLLDASNNVSMKPFRAFVTDLLPEGQRTVGFAMQSVFIGLGSVAASLMPLILTHLLRPAAKTAAHAIPLTVRYSFYLGAFAFLAAVLWTVFTIAEDPPENMLVFKAQKK